MGTLFHFDEMLPVAGEEGGKRQVEIFSPSGQTLLVLRIGEIGDQNMGRGAEVALDKKAARDLLEGLQRAMGYIGFDR
jgi:hypothetical protein